MNITILGAGNIGGTLGKKWAAAGHTIVFGVRDANSPKTQTALTGIEARAFSIPEAITVGEIILFSTPWATVPDIAQANAAALDGKILIDATNNFAGPVINNHAALQMAAPNGHLYRAFNSLGWELFDTPLVGGMAVDHYYTGPDEPTRQIVHQLIAGVGLRPIWVGGNDRIEIVDQLGALWVTLAFRQGWGRGIAFKLIEA